MGTLIFLFAVACNPSHVAAEDCSIVEAQNIAVAEAICKAEGGELGELEGGIITAPVKAMAEIRGCFVPDGEGV